MDTAARGAMTSPTWMSAVLSMPLVYRSGRIGPLMPLDGRGTCDGWGGWLLRWRPCEVVGRFCQPGLGRSAPGGRGGCMFGVPIELVVGGLVLAGLGLLTALLLAERSSGRRAAQRRRHPLGAAVPAPRPPVQVTEPEGPLPFAEPGMRSRLFQYGGDGPGFPVDAPYAVIDVETTGFSPAAGDRIVEIAIARVDASGRIEDEYATLLNPDGCDTGPVFIHGISSDAVRDAPRFAEVLGDILTRLDGCVIVAHNAAFEE